jgi:DNA-binding transcriptional LysR family regulator
MDRLHLMTVFVAVAEERGFAGGGRKLGMSPPAVTRAIATLEERLGVKLLNRSTRHVRMTEAGMRYFEDSRRIINEVDDADEAAAGINAAPRGNLAITAPVLFGSMYVMPIIVEYIKLYPGVDISALFLDRIVSIIEEGIDVAIRIGDLPDSSMRAIKVGTVRRVLCASTGYFAQHGIPKNPHELSRHQIVAATSVSPNIEWKFREGKEIIATRIKPRLIVSSNDAAIEAVMRDVGITRLMSYQVAPQLASGELKTVLSEYELPPLPVHVIHREGRYASVKIRTFIDFVASSLKSHDALN